MNENKELDIYFGLPKDVIFCRKCVISNQRPNSTLEFKHNIISKKETIKFDKDGICDACKLAEKKDREINWNKREEELKALCVKYRRDEDLMGNSMYIKKRLCC